MGIIVLFSWAHTRSKLVYQPNVLKILDRVHDGSVRKKSNPQEAPQAGYRLLPPAVSLKVDCCLDLSPQLMWKCDETWYGWIRLAWKDVRTDVFGGNKGRRQRDLE